MVLEARDTIEVSDIDFSNLLEEVSDINVPQSLFKWGETVNMVSKVHVEIPIFSATKSLVSEEFEPIANALYAFLPLYLQYYFNIPYNKTAGMQIYRKLKVWSSMACVLMVFYLANFV